MRSPCTGFGVDSRVRCNGRSPHENRPVHSFSATAKTEILGATGERDALESNLALSNKYESVRVYSWYVVIIEPGNLRFVIHVIVPDDAGAGKMSLLSMNFEPRDSDKKILSKGSS